MLSLAAMQYKAAISLLMTAEDAAKDMKARTLRHHRRLVENYCMFAGGRVFHVQMAGGRAVNILAGLPELASDRSGVTALTANLYRGKVVPHEGGSTLHTDSGLWFSKGEGNKTCNILRYIFGFS